MTLPIMWVCSGALPCLCVEACSERLSSSPAPLVLPCILCKVLLPLPLALLALPGALALGGFITLAPMRPQTRLACSVFLRASL